MNMSSDRVSLRDIVADRLKSYVVARNLKPGATETELASSLPTRGTQLSQKRAVRSGALVAVWLLLVWSTSAALEAAEPKPAGFTKLAAEYAQSTHRLLQRFCLECHSTAAPEGELDLERFATFAEVRRDPAAWQQVVEMLDNGEMPPKDFQPQPAPAERQQLRDWAERYLHAEALANAGDPGPVVLRRLNNAQYTYTIRDLTGVALDPAREFPADGAAGEGFTNTGSALVISPALLTKYLDAGKEIAKHAVLLPDGFRFSPFSSRRDWTNEVLAKIRKFYGQFSVDGGGMQVNLQGIVFGTNTGGLLPTKQYLLVTLLERDVLRSGDKSIAEVAQQHALNEKYLGMLWSALNDERPSMVLDSIRAQWHAAQPEEIDQLVREVNAWQAALFRFSSVGHIGKAGGPKAWQTPLTPLTSQQAVRKKLSAPSDKQEVVLYLVTSDAGDGTQGDLAIWERPRIVAPGRPEILLRDVRAIAAAMQQRRDRFFASTANALQAVEAASRTGAALDVEALAKAHRVDADLVTAWLDYLGIGVNADIQLDHFTEKITRSGDYDFVKGWRSQQGPSLQANASDKPVRVPGNMKPQGVCVHPSPTHSAAVGWQSPIDGQVSIQGQVTHAHPECGNGVTWSLELRRGRLRRRLASGVAQGGNPSPIESIDNFTIQKGDLLSLLIGPRDGNHACDLTDLELVIESQEDEPRSWHLSRDISRDVLAGNPQRDRYGHQRVWHFYSEPVPGEDTLAVIPAGSLLTRWQTAKSAEEKQKLASALQTLLTTGPAADADEKHPDVVLYRQLTAFGGPLFPADWLEQLTHNQQQATDKSSAAVRFGLDPALFGKHPDGAALDAASLCVTAPTVLEIRLPAELAAGAELVATGRLAPSAGGEGSVQLQVLDILPRQQTGLKPSAVTEANLAVPWTSDGRRVSHQSPILVQDGSAARKRFEQAFHDFRQLFPVALCYTEIVPVDEVVTLTLFYREDEALQRLMLNEEQVKQLDRLWAELHFISHDALTLVDAFQQLLEYASQDGDPTVYEPLREPIESRAAAFKQQLINAEPKQIEALVAFAKHAYRRPLKDGEAEGLRELYRQLREQELSHEEAFRFTLARIFISPAFLYRLEEAPAGTAPGPVSDWELASRLSYFLWSGPPDEKLLAMAAAGRLQEPDALVSEARRMLASPRMRRLATEFASQWLQVYEFDTLDEKSPEAFPEFAELRGDMYEETLLFFTDLFHNDRSVLEIFDADHTFLNARLAEFYGIPLDPAQAESAAPLRELAVTASGGEGSSDWYRVTGVRQYARGGIMKLATTLAKNSGASRTSPILRGTWVSEVLLGQPIPNPPPDVPPFPEITEDLQKLSVRELTELHTRHAACAGCHARVDPLGFAMENYDAIGRYREQDRHGKPLDTQAELPDGTQVDGLNELRHYLVTQRRETLVRQFCRKLLGYALGRGVQLSDEPLLDEMQRRLAESDYRFSVAIETIVQSQQFREIRGRDAPVVPAH